MPCTLAAWHERFEANRDRSRALYDERFCRMWEFYLQSCEAGFRWSGLTVFQLQITRAIDALPMTRDYMMREEDTAARWRTRDEPRSDRVRRSPRARRNLRLNAATRTDANQRV